MTPPFLSRGAHSSIVSPTSSLSPLHGRRRWWLAARRWWRRRRKAVGHAVAAVFGAESRRSRPTSPRRSRSSQALLLLRAPSRLGSRHHRTRRRSAAQAREVFSQARRPVPFPTETTPFVARVFGAGRCTLFVTDALLLLPGGSREGAFRSKCSFTAERCACRTCLSRLCRATVAHMGVLASSKQSPVRVWPLFGCVIRGGSRLERADDSCDLGMAS